jgi:glycosidase
MMMPNNWFDRAVIYQVFLDRFNGFKSTSNVPGFAGGTLNGVTQRLDYLKDLGINVIWLSPFYETASYHGYHITDFEKVDPRFGNEDDLRDLIFKAKKMGFKVIADFVPNHCSVHHPFFRQAIAHQKSPYRKWFIFENWPGTYRSFFDFKELPKLNLDHNEARSYIIDVAHQWLSFGLDGFRLDHVIGPSHDFWRAFSRELRSKHPESVLIGEAWAGGLEKKFYKTVGFKYKSWRKMFGVSQEQIQLEYRKTLDGVLDFTLRDMVKDAMLRGVPVLSDPQFSRQIRLHLGKVPAGYYMVTFLDNHDTDRFIRYCGGNVDLLLQAFELLFSLDLPLVLYTGTENCRPNEREVTPMHANSDLQVRAPMDWAGLNREFVDGFSNLVKKYRSAKPERYRDGTGCQ